MPAQRGGQHLVAHADAEHRHLAQQVRHRRRARARPRRGRRGRSTGTRRRARAGQDVLPPVVGAGTTSTVADRGEVAHDRGLDAQVDRDDPAGRAPVLDGTAVGLGGRSRRRPGRGRRCRSPQRQRPPQRGLVGGAEHPGQRAVVAQVAGQAAGVDAGDAGDAVARAGRRPGSPSARQLLWRRARSRTTTPAQRGAGDSSSVGVDAVVADVGVGEGDDLPGVGRVRDDLLVAADSTVLNTNSPGGDAARRARRRWPRPRTVVPSASTIAAVVGCSSLRPLRRSRPVRRSRKVWRTRPRTSVRRRARCGCATAPPEPSIVQRGRRVDRRTGWPARPPPIGPPWCSMPAIARGLPRHAGQHVGLGHRRHRRRRRPAG